MSGKKIAITLLVYPFILGPLGFILVSHFYHWWSEQEETSYRKRLEPIMKAYRAAEEDRLVRARWIPELQEAVKLAQEEVKWSREDLQHATTEQEKVRLEIAHLKKRLAEFKREPPSSERQQLIVEGTALLGAKQAHANFLVEQVALKQKDLERKLAMLTRKQFELQDSMAQLSGAPVSD